MKYGPRRDAGGRFCDVLLFGLVLVRVLFLYAKDTITADVFYNYSSFVCVISSIFAELC